MNRLVKIVIAGEGGQGVQSIADILAEAGNEEGLEALYIPNFGIEQRGGVSVAFVQIADNLIGSPKFEKGDVVVALSERAVNRVKCHVGMNTIFVYDNSLIDIEEAEEHDLKEDATIEDSTKEEECRPVEKEDQPVQLPDKVGKVIAVPATAIAKRDLNLRVFNVIILGAIVAAAGVVSEKNIKKAIENKLGKKFDKNPELRELNFNALQLGIDAVKEALVRSEADVT